jgi:acetyl-CoA carboxylase carboxyl transferase subunit beta
MWFKKDRAPKEPREGRQSKVPEGLWVKCDNCRQILYNKELARNFKICPKCGFHFRLSAPERLRMLFDEEEYVELDSNLRSSDPLKFRDSKKYRDRLRDAENTVGPSDAIVVGSGTLEGIPVVIGAMEFFFMAGSMGSVVGEKIARAAERSLAERKPLIIVSTSGASKPRSSPSSASSAST